MPEFYGVLHTPIGYRPDGSPIFTPPKTVEEWEKEEHERRLQNLETEFYRATYPFDGLYDWERYLLEKKHENHDSKLFRQELYALEDKIQKLKQPAQEILDAKIATEEARWTAIKINSAQKENLNLRQRRRYRNKE